MKPTILIIGLVWPEPTSSAAGWRMLQLIAQLKQFGDVHFACAASRSESSFPLSDLGVIEHSIVLNDEMFNDFAKGLKPDVVMYDRFMTEEQFSWRVRESCPDVVSVLDAEDLHFVRRARMEAFKHNSATDFDTSDCRRELSSIYRCDITIVISEHEYDLLINHFRIPEKQLLYLPFIEEGMTDNHLYSLPVFEDRCHLMFIGNFIHEPNYQTVRQLKRIWPLIKSRLPDVELHVYGAYASQKVMQLQNKKQGFIIKGKAADVGATMRRYRVLAAPIPFGAGLKGKFVDGYRNGLPNVTTKVGSEGMDSVLWGGLIAESDEEFADAVATLYNNAYLWKQSVANGKELINKLFSLARWNGMLKNVISGVLEDTEMHRETLFVQKILWQNSQLAMKYLSLWIEEKNK